MSSDRNSSVMTAFSRNGRMWALSCVTVLVVIVTWVFISSNADSGDPGGRLMDQLTPTVSSLPGYGTGVPWVSQKPQSLAASYAIKIEPYQDSCDGLELPRFDGHELISDYATFAVA